MLEKNPKRTGSFYAQVEIHGLGGHSSTPYRTKNPLVAGFEFIHAVQNKVWWEFSTFNNVTLFPVDFASGVKGNIIPETASITLYGEYAEAAEYATLKTIVTTALEGIKTLYHVDYQLTYTDKGAQ